MATRTPKGKSSADSMPVALVAIFLANSVMVQNKKAIVNADANTDTMLIQYATSVTSSPAKKRKETAQHQKERGAGRVAHLQLVRTGDELTAVPKAGGRLHRGKVGEKRPPKR